MPQYELVVEQIPRYSAECAEIVLKCSLKNGDVLKRLGDAPNTFSVLLVGDSDNSLVFKQRLSYVLNGVSR